MAKSDRARIAVIQETVIGTTPANPSFIEVRALSDSLGPESQVSESAELVNAPGITNQIRGGIDVQGSIVMPFAYNDVLDLFMAGILGHSGAWAEGATIVPAFTRRSFTIEKGYIDVAGVRRYHRFVGVSASSIEISYQPRQPLQATVTFVGGRFEVGETIIPGATYAAPTPTAENAPQMRSAKTSVLWGGSLSGMNAWCHTAFALTLDRQNTARECIGKEAAEEWELGTLRAAVSASILYGGNAANTAHLAGTEATLSVIMQGDQATPNIQTYSALLNRFKLTQVRVPTPAKGSDVLINLEGEGLQPTAGDVVDLTRDLN